MLRPVRILDEAEYLILNDLVTNPRKMLQMGRGADALYGFGSVLYEESGRQEVGITTAMITAAVSATPSPVDGIVQEDPYCSSEPAQAECVCHSRAERTMTRPAAPKCQGQESTPCDAMGNESLRQRCPDRGCPHPQYVGYY